METDDDLRQSDPVKPIVIGLDIGTTYSGAAWQFEDEVYFVLGWPDSLGNNQDRIKVPSILHLDDEKLVTGWGYKSPDDDAHVLEWSKLALVSEHKLPPHLLNSLKLKEARRKIQDLGIDATEVIAHYVDKITTHTLREIKDHIGAQEFDTRPVHVVITVPAIWDNQPIEKMKTAAGASILQPRPAGPTTYRFISEPEAAVQAYANKLQRKLRVGDIVIVVDLGGGTVDLTSYQKIGVGEESRMALQEAVPGSGGLCGAIFADEKFEELLLSRMPRKYKNIKERNPEAWEAILSDQWHRKIKTNFEWKRKNQLCPVVLTNLDHKLDVQLHEDEIRNVFENSVMPEILDLINGEIEKVEEAYDGKVPRIILPVGGFGRCPYVLQRLREEYNPSSLPSNLRKPKKQKRDGPEIEVHSDKGEVPWGAVAKGACLSGMSEQSDNRLVKSRRARYSLGFSVSEYASAEEGGSYDPKFHRYMKRHVMEWVITKGELIPTQGRKSTIQMELSCPFEGKGIRSEHSEIFIYDSDSPPKRYNRRDPGFRVYGVMEITAPKRMEKLPTTRFGSEEKPFFPYHLEIEIMGSSVQITAISDCDGDEGQEVGHFLLPDLDTE